MIETDTQAKTETKSQQDVYKDLLAIAKKIWPDRHEREKHTGLSRTTEWRIETGRFRFHAATINGLVRAINAK